MNVSNSESYSASAGGLPLLDKDLLSACIHCGLCLPACPTYLASGLESESPRGRIYLLNMLRQGQIESSDESMKHIDSCLGCMGCQTACPSGVKYEKILSQARPILAAKRQGAGRNLLRAVFSRVLPDYMLLKMLGSMARLAQKLKLTTVRPSIPFAPQLSKRLAQWQIFLPHVPPRRDLPAPSGKSDIQLFAGCVMDILYNAVNHAAIRLLNRQGRVVGVPLQTCCGALAAHSGEIDIARSLAKQNIELFEGTSGAIAVTSAGCGAMLKEYGELFEHDEVWRNRAAAFSARVQDTTEVLAGGQFEQGTPQLQQKIAYHAACHLAHVQKVREAPVKLLNMIEGSQLVPLEEQEHCCGSAGIYNLVNPETSLAILERKMKYIEETGVECIATANPGCLLQLEAGAKIRGLKLRVVHPLVLLDEAFEQKQIK